MDTDHDELNQNLLCESINEEFLKPAIKASRSNEKFRSPVGESKLNSPATQRSPTISQTVFSEGTKFANRESRLADNQRRTENVSRNNTLTNESGSIDPNRKTQFTL